MYDTSETKEMAEMPLDPPVVETTSPSEASAAWQQSQKQIQAFFNDPTSYLAGFWQTYKPILLVFGWIFLTLVVINLTLTLLSAIFGVVTGIPILSPLLELVGIGYTIWFISRYLLSASSRQELTQKIDDFKTEISGKVNEDPQQQLNEGMERFKQVMEIDETSQTAP
jgi:CAAD domains of cyanobacterial aminoacyl-tRNA synthetase